MEQELLVKKTLQCARCGRKFTITLKAATAHKSRRKFCDSCIKLNNRESMHEVYIRRARKKRMKAPKVDLKHEIAMAQRYGLSYGKYVLLKDTEKLPPLPKQKRVKTTKPSADKHIKRNFDAEINAFAFVITHPEVNEKAIQYGERAYERSKYTCLV